MFCRDHDLTPMFSSPLRKICLKETEVWQKVVSNQIYVTLIAEGLQSSFLFRPMT